MRKLRPGGGEQKITLVATAVTGAKQLRPMRAEAALDIMSRRQHVGIELLSRGQQLVELDLLVAGHTWDRRFAGSVAVGKGLHDGRFEALLVVQHVVRNGQTIRHATRVVNVLAGAAGPGPSQRLAVIVELQGDADDLVTLLFQHRRRDRRINAPGHRYDDSAFAPGPNARRLGRGAEGWARRHGG